MASALRSPAVGPLTPGCPHSDDTATGLKAGPGEKLYGL